MDISNFFTSQILSVSDLNALVASHIEKSIGEVQVEGEVGNFTASRAGHWYFTLKDGQSQVACAMFGVGRHAKKISVGDQIQVKACASIYRARGTFQLIIQSYQPIGIGKLLQHIAQRKYALEKEGLFDESAKKTLPFMCQRIGVITAPNGAAITDVIRTCQRRSPLSSVYIYPSLVQGEGAVQSIIDAIDLAQEHNQCEVLIVGRGGGSLEDLMPYNDEQLVRAMYACPIPIISAVGHERDFTLVDYVADKRASTPTAAAEILTLDMPYFLQQLDEYTDRMYRTVHENIHRNEERIDNLCKRLVHPNRQIQTAQLQLQNCQNHMAFAIKNVLDCHQQMLDRYAAQLYQLNPKHILRRGFALVHKTTHTDMPGDVITSAQQARQTQHMSIHFSDGIVPVSLQKK